MIAFELLSIEIGSEVLDETGSLVRQELLDKVDDEKLADLLDELAASIDPPAPRPPAPAPSPWVLRAPPGAGGPRPAGLPPESPPVGHAAVVPPASISQSGE